MTPAQPVVAALVVAATLAGCSPAVSPLPMRGILLTGDCTPDSWQLTLRELVTTARFQRGPAPSASRAVMLAWESRTRNERTRKRAMVLLWYPDSSEEMRWELVVAERGPQHGGAQQAGVSSRRAWSVEYQYDSLSPALRLFSVKPDTDDADSFLRNNAWKLPLRSETHDGAICRETWRRAFGADPKRDYPPRPTPRRMRAPKSAHTGAESPAVRP